MNNSLIPTLNPTQAEVVKNLQASASSFQQWQFELFFGVFVITAIIIFVILWLISIINVLNRDFRNSNDKLIWFLALIFLPFLAPVYFISVRKKDKNKVK